MRCIYFFAFVLSISLITHAQSQLPVPLNVKAAYTKGTRSADGRPGKNYWQNTANYTIQVNFTPDTRVVSGTEEIVYTNNSPDTLSNILFKLYPNYYKKGSARLKTIDGKDIDDNGMMIQQMEINGKPIDVKQLKIDGTNMRIPIAKQLPRQSIHFKIQFSYVLNKGSHDRTGQVDEGSYFVAYFFPRIAVYDDIDKWNYAPYLGTQEFYNDFCNFKINISVPKSYVVWATGDLKNCSEVFSNKICQRIENAEHQDNIITIVDSTDIQQGNVTANNETNIWKYEADNVTDFVFALSNHYMWQAGSVVVDKKTGRRTRVDAVFNPLHKDFFEVSHFARKTVELMSYEFPKWPFPYSHETVFDGLDQMEYPMMVNDNPLESRNETIMLTDHEIFHTMFPFYMGINETKHAWMDEGWATIGEWLLTSMIDSTVVDDYAMSNYSYAAGGEYDLPIITPSTQLSGLSYQINSYPKPALGYLYVKDLLGDELFYKGLHHYISLWNGKHPIPYDFFYSMNTGSGKNLNWFWKRWFFDNNYPDLAISKVNKTGKQYNITVNNIGGKPVPIDLIITYQDSSTQKIHRNISVWEKGNQSVDIRSAANKKVKSLKLGSTHIPDANKKDNIWEEN